jgi:hypothetical protein
MIELNDESYIVGIWFSSDPVSNNNWMSGFIKDPDNLKRYKGWSRFRYNKDDKVFDSEDDKIWADLTAHEDQNEDDIINTMRLAQLELKSAYPDTDEIIVKGRLKKLMKLARGKSWMNMKASGGE